MSRQVFRQQALDKLNSPDDLNELLTVTSPKSWLLVSAVGILLLATLVWSLFATIETSVPGNGIIKATENEDTLEVILYVSVADGRRIQPGVTAKISPSTVRGEEFGMLLATVSSIAQTPSTQAEMLAVLENDALVQSLASAGSIIEVRLDLVRDPTTPSGYKWTSAEGPPTAIWGGTLADGAIIIHQQRPFDLLLVR